MIVVQVIITLIIFVSTEILFPNNHYHRFNTGLLMALIIVTWGYFYINLILGLSSVLNHCLACFVAM